VASAARRKISVLARRNPTNPQRLPDQPGLFAGLLQSGHDRRAIQFLRVFRSRMRSGRLSRAPLRLLRFQWHGNSVECDWLARPGDSWDAGLPPLLIRQNASEQALEDAIQLRALLFKTIPGLDSAELCVFRDSSHSGRELVAAGHAEPNDSVAPTVRSLAMRAKLFGFRFTAEDGVLQPLSPA
jgi:hypothetical protein